MGVSERCWLPTLFSSGEPRLFSLPATPRARVLQNPAATISPWDWPRIQFRRPHLSSSSTVWECRKERVKENRQSCHTIKEATAKRKTERTDDSGKRKKNWLGEAFQSQHTRRASDFLKKRNFSRKKEVKRALSTQSLGVLILSFFHWFFFWSEKWPLFSARRTASSCHSNLLWWRNDPFLFLPHMYSLFGELKKSPTCIIMQEALMQTILPVFSATEKRWKRRINQMQQCTHGCWGRQKEDKNAEEAPMGTITQGKYFSNCWGGGGRRKLPVFSGW